MTDTERFDFLEKNTGYTLRWVARKSIYGRGYRLHNTSSKPNYPTAREAVDAAIKVDQIEEENESLSLR